MSLQASDYLPFISDPHQLKSVHKRQHEIELLCRQPYSKRIINCSIPPEPKSPERVQKPPPPRGMTKNGKIVLYSLVQIADGTDERYHINCWRHSSRASGRLNVVREAKFKAYDSHFARLFAPRHYGPLERMWRT